MSGWGRRCGLLAALYGALAGFSGDAGAALLEADWKAPGDAKITRDAGTGLDWLDIPETVNITQQTMLGLLAPGGAFSAFRYPTITELRGFWSNAGIVSIDPPGSPNRAENAGPVLALIALIGETTGAGASPGFHAASAIYGPPFPELQATIGELVYCPAGCLSGGSDAGSAKVLGLVTGFNAPHPYIGHWLVRATPVSEPGALVLLGGALAGLAWWRHRA